MVDDNTVKKITNYCIENLDFDASGQGPEYYYASLPLCAIDSVFSIGVRYEGVTNVIDRLSKHYDIQICREIKTHTLPDREKQISTTELIQLLEKDSIDFLASKVFQNRQQTSTKKGILKVDAVIRFLKVLQEFHVEYFQDIAKIVTDKRFDDCIKGIPGQRSGISLKYFFMLAGSTDLIKPDRWVVRFLENASGENYHSQKDWQEDCQKVLSAVTLGLKKERHELTPQLVDYAIWKYMRNRIKDKKKATL